MPSPQKTQPSIPQLAPVRQGPWVEGALDGKALVSQVSHVWLMMPSPHVGSVQLLRQLSVSMAFPSSHASPPLTMPSPQKVHPMTPHVSCPVRQAPWDEGAVDGKALPSHVSHVWLMVPSPQISTMTGMGLEPWTPLSPAGKWMVPLAGSGVFGLVASPPAAFAVAWVRPRSEERRVGKECRAGGVRGSCRRNIGA